MAKTKKKTINAKAIIAAIVGGIVAAGVAITLVVVAINGGKVPNVTIEYSGQKKSAKIVMSNGEEKDVTNEVETVEAVEVNEKEQVKADDEEHGQGAWYGIDLSTPVTVKDSTFGRCLNVDGWYGAQCWDLSAAISETQVGRRLSTCGTGAASGMMNCWESNAGDEYDVIWDATQVRPGDILVFSGGVYGHTGMATGYYNNGYVTLLGQNQGGNYCDQGGSSTNIINMSLATFKGAYRWKGWNHLFEVKEEPKAEEAIPITGCVEWAVKRGDTMSKIMIECEGTLQYGEVMNRYADSWYSRYVVPGQSVYYGWTHGSGVGLYNGDTIDHKVEQ